MHASFAFLCPHDESKALAARPQALAAKSQCWGRDPNGGKTSGVREAKCWHFSVAIHSCGGEKIRGDIISVHRKTNSSGDFGAPAEPSGLERQCRAPQRSRAGSKSETSAGAVFSSSQAEQFRAPWRSRASSSSHFERPSGAERARAAISSAPAEPSGLEVGNVGRCSVFEQPGRAISSALAEPSEFERPFRAPQRSRAGSSGHFERPSGAERARAAISSAPAEPSGLDVANVGRCGVFEARPSQLSELVPGMSKPSMYIYIYIIHWLGFRKCKKSVCMFALKFCSSSSDIEQHQCTSHGMDSCRSKESQQSVVQTSALRRTLPGCC